MTFDRKAKLTQLELSDSTHSGSSSAPSAQSSPAYAKEARQDDKNLLIKQTASGDETATSRYDSYIHELELKVSQVRSRLLPLARLPPTL